MNKNFEQLKTKSIEELLEAKKANAKEIVIEIAKLAQSGRKSTKKIQDLKREIAWIETLVSGKITEVKSGN